MFLLDTSSILVLNNNKKAFHSNFITTSKVVKELKRLNFNFKEIGPLILTVTIRDIKTADQEIVIVKEKLRGITIVTEDYYLRKKLRGISIRKLLINR